MVHPNGIITALATPFDAHHAVDLAAWKALLATQIKAKISAVVVAGSTGESPTLTRDERKLLLREALQACEGSQTQVIAGTGTNNTATTIEFSKDAEALGVKQLLIVTPYYNRPTQAGLEAHFTAVAKATGCNVILYNVPGRTGVSITPETVARLTAHSNITGLKEATGDLNLMRKYVELKAKLSKPFALYSGDDPTFVQARSLGADGVISVASNVVPKEMIDLDRGLDSKAFARLFPLFCDLGIEPNPVPVKQVLEWQKIMRGDVRLPLVRLAPENLARLKATFEKVMA